MMRRGSKLGRRLGVSRGQYGWARGLGERGEIGGPRKANRAGSGWGCPLSAFFCTFARLRTDENREEMKTFLKMLLAVIVGIFLYGLLMFFFFMAIGAAVSKSGEDSAPKVKEHSILRIKLSEPIVDRLGKFDYMTQFMPFGAGSMGSEHELLQVLWALEYAKDDDNIDGIYIEADGLGTSLTNMEELRPALQAFREESGKFIYTYSTGYGQGQYVLVGESDKILLNPAGEVQVPGLSTRIRYVKGFFDRFGITPQVIRHGKFKSAVEPYLQESMSEANRLQLSTYLNTVWDYMANAIAKSRGMQREALESYAKGVVMSEAADAVRYGLADSLVYVDQVDSLLREETAREEDEDINFVSLEDYVQYAKTKRKVSPKGDRVAVLYAQGEIVDTDETEGEIGSKGFIEEIRKLRKDDKVKAVVMRVNSPGGSALASEEIWRELTLLKQEKPLVVSMGDYAASGGYYISCVANEIVADTTTLTGSIGVFGVIFSVEKLMKETFKVNSEVVRTHEHADMGSPDRLLTAEEKAMVQRSVENVYSVFTSRVAAGRGMTQAAVDSIGQGRIWSGADAVKIGLVDTLGGLQLAIERAAKLAELDDYQIREFPKRDANSFDAFLRKMMRRVEVRVPKAVDPMKEELRRQAQELEGLLQRRGIRAELPYRVDVR